LFGRENRRKPLSCRKFQTKFITQCCIDYTSPWSEIKLSCERH
jgi:hypothetical protein